MKILSDFLKIYAARFLAGLLGYLLTGVVAAALRFVLGYGKQYDDLWWSAWELWFLFLAQVMYSLISILFYVINTLWVLLVSSSASSFVSKGLRVFLIMLVLDMTRLFVSVGGPWLIRREAMAGFWSAPLYTIMLVGELLTAVLFVFFYFRTNRYIYISLCMCIVLYMLLIFVGFP